jgi:hypothetical protein
LFCSEECARDLWTRSRQLIGVKRGREEKEAAITTDPRLLLALPKDVLVLILEKLSIKALLRVAGTNQYLRNVIRDKNVWERVIGRSIPEYARENELAFAFSVWIFEQLMSGVKFKIGNIELKLIKPCHQSIYSYVLKTDIDQSHFDHFKRFAYDIEGCYAWRGREEVSFVSKSQESMIQILYNFWKNGYRWTIPE